MCNTEKGDELSSESSDSISDTNETFAEKEKSSSSLYNISSKSEIFKNYDNWFKKNGHLFKAKAVRYAEKQKDIINDSDYFTIQIPRHLEKYNIEKQIEKIRQVHKVGRIPSLQSVKFI